MSSKSRGNRLRQEETGPFYYWENPSEGEAFVGLGSAHVIAPDQQMSGDDIFREIQRVIGERQSNEPISPLFAGGLAFDQDSQSNETWREFPRLWMVLPRELILKRDGAVYFIETTPCPAGSLQTDGSKLRLDG